MSYNQRLPKLIVTEVGRSVSDNEVMETLKALLLPTNKIHLIESIQVRNSTNTNFLFKSAFIHFHDIDPYFPMEACNLLNNAVIGLSAVKAALAVPGQALPPNYNQPISPQSILPQPNLVPQEMNSNLPVSLLPTRQDLYNSSVEYVQLHIAPLPNYLSDEITRDIISKQLNHHFLSNDYTVLKTINGRKMAFVSIYNRSDNSLADIMQTLSSFTIDDVRIVVTLQNKSSKSSLVQVFAHELIRLNSQYVPHTTLTVIPDPINDDGSVPLYFNNLPILNTGPMNLELITTLLEDSFKDTCKVKLFKIPKNDRMAAFVDVFNKSTESTKTIMLRLSSIKIQNSSGPLGVTFRRAPKLIEAATTNLPGANTASINVITNEDYNPNSLVPAFGNQSSAASSVSNSLANMQKEYWLNRIENEFKNIQPVKVLPSDQIEAEAVRELSPSPDPFDLIASNYMEDVSYNQFQDLSNLILSPKDSRSIDLLSQPIHLPPDPHSFNRTVATEFIFGRLSSKEAQEALDCKSPFWNHQNQQIEYEKFLISQSNGDKDQYLKLLENLEGFNQRNRMFSEIANSLV